MTDCQFPRTVITEVINALHREREESRRYPADLIFPQCNGTDGLIRLPPTEAQN